MKDFVEKLIERLGELKNETESEMNLLLDREYLLPCSMNQIDMEEYRVSTFEETIEIVKQLAEEYENDFCEWKFTKSVADGVYIFSSGCNHKRFSDLNGFEYCPYCGKKIKVVQK